MRFVCLGVISACLCLWFVGLVLLWFDVCLVDVVWMFCLGCFGCSVRQKFGWDCLFQVFSLSRVDFVVFVWYFVLNFCLFRFGIVDFGVFAEFAILGLCWFWCF